MILTRFNPILFFLLFGVSHASCLSLKAVQQHLQGKWISVQDPNYTITFNKKFVVEETKNDAASESFRYFISNRNCGFDFKICSGRCFYLKKRNLDGDITLCYLIRSATENSLTLIYEGGRVLDFTR
jgi:hypothetical protein